MNARVLAQTKPGTTSVPWVRSNLLQRKCACGGTPGLTGECEACKKKRLALQTKLKINEPRDIYEQEADRVADQVMAASSSPAVSGIPPRIQHFSGQSSGRTESAPASVDQALASPSRALEPALRRDMEQFFGHDFSGVRVHDDAAAAQSAQDVNAIAYTIGQNIVFGAGRFAKRTPEGRHVLAHELTHVVQQSRACVGHIREGDESNDNIPVLGSAALAIMRYPDVAVTTTNALLDHETRENLRMEVGSRIDNVVGKCRTALGIIYTEEKTLPNKTSWGIVADVVFKLVAGFVTDGVSTGLTFAVKKFVRDDFFSEETRWIGRSLNDVVEESAKNTKAAFEFAKPILVDKAKDWLKDKAKSSTSDKAKKWVEISSDLYGAWAQELRDKYIVSARTTFEDDSKLLGAYAAFDNELYKQEELDEAAEFAWKQLAPILEGGRERYHAPLVRGTKYPEHEYLFARSRVAEIVAPNHAKRLAIVDEFYAVGGMGMGKETPTGQYTFYKWVPALMGLTGEREVRAIQRQINGTDLLNYDDPDLQSWIMGNLPVPSAKEEATAGRF